MIVPPPTDRVIVAVTHPFWERELAQGTLLRVTCLPGFGWIHTLSLEAWFEADTKNRISSQPFNWLASSIETDSEVLALL